MIKRIPARAEAAVVSFKAFAENYGLFRNVVFPFHRPKTIRIEKCVLFENVMRARSYVT